MAVPYIFLCAGCGALAVSERSDALTCSVACRVNAHRSGRLKQLRAEAKAAHIPPGALVQSEAILELSTGPQPMRPLSGERTSYLADM